VSFKDIYLGYWGKVARFFNKGALRASKTRCVLSNPRGFSPEFFANKKAPLLESGLSEIAGWVDAAGEGLINNRLKPVI
jgi:hypothetical protein